MFWPNRNLYFDKKINIEGTKFKVVDNVIIWKYENIFAESLVPNWSEEVFVIKKLKNTVSWTYVISDLKEIVRTFYEKESKTV